MLPLRFESRFEAYGCTRCWFSVAFTKVPFVDYDDINSAFLKSFDQCQNDFDATTKELVAIGVVNRMAQTLPTRSSQMDTPALWSTD